METVLVSNPLVTTNTLSSAQRVYGLVPSNTHATDVCAIVVYSGADNSGKIVYRGILPANTFCPGVFFLRPVGVGGLYVTLTGGTGTLIVYYT